MTAPEWLGAAICLVALAAIAYAVARVCKRRRRDGRR